MFENMIEANLGMKELFKWSTLSEEDLQFIKDLIEGKQGNQVVHIY